MAQEGWWRAQVVRTPARLTNKCETLSSNPSATKNKTKPKNDSRAQLWVSLFLICQQLVLEASPTGWSSLLIYLFLSAPTQCLAHSSLKVCWMRSVWRKKTKQTIELSLSSTYISTSLQFLHVCSHGSSPSEISLSPHASITQVLSTSSQFPQSSPTQIPHSSFISM
jgi:hypothetical protein